MRRQGVGVYEDATGREIAVATAVTVDDGRVVTEIGADGDDLTNDPERIPSSDRRVVWYCLKVEAAIRAKAWRERPITPDPKPRERKASHRRQ